MPLQYNIEQKDQSISIERISSDKDDKGELKKYSEELNFNGKPSTITRQYDDVMKTSSLKWDANKQSFSISSEYRMGNDTAVVAMTSTEQWALSADGKTMQVDAEMTVPGNSTKTKWIFEKQ